MLFQNHLQGCSPVRGSGHELKSSRTCRTYPLEIRVDNVFVVKVTQTTGNVTNLKSG